MKLLPLAVVLLLACVKNKSTSSQKEAESGEEQSFTLQEMSLNRHDIQLNDKLLKTQKSALKKLKKEPFVCDFKRGGDLDQRNEIKYKVSKTYVATNFAFAVAMGAFDTAWLPEPISKQMSEWGFSQTEFVSSKVWGANGFVSWNDDVVYLHYRGTANIRGAVLDALFRLTPAPKSLGEIGKLHYGMNLGHSILQKQVNEILKRADPEKRKKLVFSGHSLGSSFAQLSALSLKLAGHDFVSAYVTGGPRVGTEQFADHLDKVLGKRVFRLRLLGDIVPFVAPHRDGLSNFAEAWPGVSWIAAGLVRKVGDKMNYQHAGRVFDFHSSTGRIEESFDTDSSADVAYWEARGGKFTLKAFKEHPPMYYLCHMERIVDSIQPL